MCALDHTLRKNPRRSTALAGACLACAIVPAVDTAWFISAPLRRNARCSGDAGKEQVNDQTCLLLRSLGLGSVHDAARL